MVQSGSDIFDGRGPEDSSVGNIATRGSDTDTMGIPGFGVLYDRDLVAVRQEGVEVANENGVTVKKASYPLYDARRVDPNHCLVEGELQGSRTHS